MAAAPTKSAAAVQNIHPRWAGRIALYLPNRPCGRTARTASSMANEIAGAHDAP